MGLPLGPPIVPLYPFLGKGSFLVDLVGKWRAIPGLPGGSINYQGHLFSQKGHLWLGVLFIQTKRHGIAFRSPNSVLVPFFGEGFLFG